MPFNNQHFEVSGRIDTPYPLKYAIEYAMHLREKGLAFFTPHIFDGYLPAVQLSPLMPNAVYSRLFIGRIPPDYSGTRWIKWEDFFHAPCTDPLAAARAIQSVFLDRFRSLGDAPADVLAERCYGPGIYEKGFLLSYMDQMPSSVIENEQSPESMKIEHREYAVFSIRPFWLFRKN